MKKIQIIEDDLSIANELKELLEKEVNVEIIEGSSPDYYHYR